MDVFLSWINSFLSVMSTFQFKDAVDIICITLVVYGVFKLVRDTRAEQLLKGILILFAVYLAASIFSLSMFTSLLKNFFEYGVIILFIIFQPEVRKALEQIGRSKISNSFRFGSDKDEEEIIKKQHGAIKAVTDAAMIMQLSKTGALIVFENTTKLGEIIKTGTIIDAEPSVSILGNLFFNKAPLHDGAVIIRDGKVYAAGCILPLTKNDDVDINLGTRHRAAIGMSQESDAIVVVVSEETGNISVAYKGILTRDYTRDTLKEKLDSVLIPNGKTDIVEFIPIFSSKRKEKKNEKK